MTWSSCSDAAVGKLLVVRTVFVVKCYYFFVFEQLVSRYLMV